MPKVVYSLYLGGLFRGLEMGMEQQQQQPEELAGLWFLYEPVFGYSFAEKQQSFLPQNFALMKKDCPPAPFLPLPQPSCCMFYCCPGCPDPWVPYSGAAALAEKPVPCL